MCWSWPILVLWRPAESDHPIWRCPSWVGQSKVMPNSHNLSRTCGSILLCPRNLCRTLIFLGAGHYTMPLIFKVSACMPWFDTQWPTNSSWLQPNRHLFGYTWRELAHCTWNNCIRWLMCPSWLVLYIKISYKKTSIDLLKQGHNNWFIRAW